MKWVEKIAQTINTTLNSLRSPVIPIPPVMLLCEIMDRPGLSAITLTSAVIARLPEAGIPTGVNPDVKEFQNHAVVNGAIQPGSINITGTGIAAGIAPVSVTGTNVLASIVNAIIR